MTGIAANRQIRCSNFNPLFSFGKVEAAFAKKESGGMLCNQYSTEHGKRQPLTNGERLGIMEA